MTPTNLQGIALTDAQSRGVTRTGEQVVVTAGAGTGKTRVLTARFAHLVLSEKATVDRILAITFTEKAATEMSGRVAKIFEDTGRIDLKRKLVDASISTIHGFCARLLREHAIKAGVDPAFEMLGDMPGARMQSQALQTVLDQLKSDDPDRYDKLLRTIRTEGRFGADILTAIKKIYEHLRVGRKTIEDAFSGPDPVKNYNALFAVLKQSIADFSEAMADAKPTQTLETNGALIDSILATCETGTVEDVAREFSNAKLVMRMSAELKALAQPINDQLAQLGTFAADIYSADTRALLMEIVERFDKEFTKAKRDASLLDYSDLEQRALDLLENFPDAKNDIRSKYAFVLVDEFQDVNPLQSALIDNITDKENLFVVGDIKQSIYRFRQADVKVFSGLIENFPADRRISLTKNFRTCQPILTFVNRFFEKAWEDRPPGLAYEPLEIGSDDQKTQEDAVCVEALLARGGDDLDPRQAEAKALAIHIRNLISKKPKADFKLSDIVILFRAKTKVSIYLAEFLRLGIAFSEEKGRGFLERSEVSDLQHFLEVLADPYDELALAAVLRSPFVGIDDNALFALCEKGRELPHGLFGACQTGDDVFKNNSAAHDKIQNFLSALDSVLRKAPALSPGALVKSIFDCGGYKLWALAQPDGARRAGNIDKLSRSAMTFAEPYGQSIAGLAAALGDLRANSGLIEDAPTGPATEAITVMTVHGAKGLEAPVVILAEANRKDHNPSDAITYHPSVGVGFTVYLSDFTSVKTTKLVEVNEANKAEAAQEDLRLLYVAMTRAKERLIFSAGFRSSAKGKPQTYGWLKRLVDFTGIDLSDDGEQDSVIDLGQGAALRVLHAQNLPEPEIIEPTPAVIDSPKVLDRYDQLPYKPTAPDGSMFLYTVSEITTFAQCRRRFYLQYRLGLPLDLILDLEKSTASGGGDGSSLAFGTAVHEILSKVGRGDETLLGKTATNVIAANHLSDSHKNAAEQAVRAFWNNPDSAPVFSAEKIRRELPFLWRTNDRLIRGQIDLLAEGPEGFWLLDYKTNHVVKGREQAIADRYLLQLVLYALAAKALFGKAPDRVSLYLTAVDSYVDIPFGDEQIDQATCVIDALIEADRTGTYPPDKNHCDTCEIRPWCLD